MDRDPEETKFIPGPWHNPEEHERFLTARIQQTFDFGLGYWSIFPKRDPTQFVDWILMIGRITVCFMSKKRVEKKNWKSLRLQCHISL